jgi:hypothetical protein
MSLKQKPATRFSNVHSAMPFDRLVACGVSEQRNRFGVVARPAGGRGRRGGVKAAFSRHRPTRCLLAAGGLACTLVVGCQSERSIAPGPAASSPRAQTAVVTSVEGEAQVAIPPPRPAAAADSAPGASWQSLFDGQTLRGWEITKFAGHGEVSVRDGNLLLEMGVALTGVRYTNAVPRVNYEVALEAVKLMGNDFFCGLTFPVGESACTFIVGGWGGGVVGISSINGSDASENETTRYMEFKKNHWYAIRLRVTERKIECWIDDQPVVDLDYTGQRLGLRAGEIELSAPFGIATWQTTAALRNIRLRKW